MKTKTIFNMKRLARKMSQIFKGKDNGPLEVEANKVRGPMIKVYKYKIVSINDNFLG